MISPGTGVAGAPGPGVTTPTGAEVGRVLYSVRKLA